MIAKKCQKAKSMSRTAQELIKIGMETDEQLGKVYDAMDYVEHRMVRWIRRDKSLYMIFQYPVMLAIRQVNELGSEVDFEVLSKNMDIHKELMDTMEYYSKKAVLVLNAGFESIKQQILSEFDTEEIREICVPKWIL